MTKLFINSDTCLQFSDNTAALKYVSKQGIQSFMLLKQYPNTNTVSIFNPFLTNSKCTEYFETEALALRYIGSFI